MGAAFWVLIAILGVGFFLDRVFGVRSLDVDESSRSPVANLVDQPLIDVEALATSMDVAGIVLAIDWHARREVQASSRSSPGKATPARQRASHVSLTLPRSP